MLSESNSLMLESCGAAVAHNVELLGVKNRFPQERLVCVEKEFNEFKEVKAQELQELRAEIEELNLDLCSRNRFPIPQAMHRPLLIFNLSAVVHVSALLKD